MAPLKAPGPDGVHALFFQENWEVVGPTMFALVREAFMIGTFSSILNQTHITLMSKVEQAETVNHLRPISLSNVAYKVITKCLVNRIRPFMKSIVGPFQSNFIPGRSTADNILLLQEVMSMFKKKRGKKVVW